MSNLIDPTDPRVGRLTYVAVCRACGGWQYLADAEATDAEMMRDVKRAAAVAFERGSDFKQMRFGDVNLTMCECGRPKKAPRQKVIAI